MANYRHLGVSGDLSVPNAVRLPCVAEFFYDTNRHPDCGVAVFGLGLVITAEVLQRTVNGGAFIAPNRRNFGMVFQCYALWSRMNVFKNAVFPLEVGNPKFRKKEVEERVMRVLTAVGLDEFADREATKMSGGQRSGWHSRGR